MRWLRTADAALFLKLRCHREEMVSSPLSSPVCCVPKEVHIQKSHKARTGYTVACFYRFSPQLAHCPTLIPSAAPHDPFPTISLVSSDCGRHIYRV
ncbi:hypothetical protein NDU88_004258 [Pleurodeles waltl]|uniref:Uncharacterized protein n=1 Tax=Pleurodeles waltl TaxID=8319 RepID=A0AAV7WUK1_PLEWA|nr:hypothetical protein NDU88_004258 [Pleurodeles waltl]